MKDAERLELLKEIGGTKVYEERRKESLRILQDTEGRRQRINDVVRLGRAELGHCHCASMMAKFWGTLGHRLEAAAALDVLQGEPGQAAGYRGPSPAHQSCGEAIWGSVALALPTSSESRAGAQQELRLLKAHL